MISFISAELFKNSRSENMKIIAYFCSVQEVKLKLFE